MGFAESDSSKCRRHPYQKQLPGVCSCCLREKLTKLSISPSFNKRSTTFISDDTSSYTSSPPYSTASSSSVTTTTTRKSPGHRHRRNGSEAYVSVGMVLNNGFKKSRSVSCAPLSKTKLIGANFDCVNNDKVIGAKINKSFMEGGKIVEDGNMKKKSGFLKKLIHSTSKKTRGVLTQSKTMKERSNHTTNAITNNKN